MAVLVILLLPVGELPHGVIDEDVTGTRIEVVDLQVSRQQIGLGLTRKGDKVEYLINSTVAVGRDKANVADTADVLAGSKFRGVVEDQSVEEGDQGSSLPAIGLLVDSEVIDNGFVKHLCHDGTLGHGKRRLDLLSARHRKEPDSLPPRQCLDFVSRGWMCRRTYLAVGGDDIDIVECEIEILEHAEDGIGKVNAKHKIDLGHFLGRGAVLSNQSEYSLLDLVVMLHLFVLRISVSNRMLRIYKTGEASQQSASSSSAIPGTPGRIRKGRSPLHPSRCHCSFP